jgi:hypothetical protein
MRVYLSADKRCEAYPNCIGPILTSQTNSHAQLYPYADANANSDCDQYADANKAFG